MDVFWYTSAYLFGIKATDVITGMGFKFFTFKTKSTTFRFNIIPGGGVTIYPQNQELTLSRLKQFIVLGSGVTFNYIAAVCATTLYLKTSPIAGFLAFNQMIINFIKTLFYRSFFGTPCWNGRINWNDRQSIYNGTICSLHFYFYESSSVSL